MAQPHGQKAPLRIPAPDTETTNKASFIFLHGFGDDAEGWIDIAHQFQAAKKLTHLTWIFPTAPFNHEAMSTAWYTPTSFSPIPVGSSSSSSTTTHPDPEPEEDSAAEEILASIEYICTLIDSEVQRGVNVKRIIVGGFSQGCAVSLVLALVKSRYKGRLGGVVGLSGYLPIINPKPLPPKDPKDEESVERQEEYESENEAEIKVFLAHGTKDMLAPLRIFRSVKSQIEGLGISGEGRLIAKTYEGMGHATCGPEFRDLCLFLEDVVPP